MNYPYTSAAVVFSPEGYSQWKSELGQIVLENKTYSKEIVKVFNDAKKHKRDGDILYVWDSYGFNSILKSIFYALKALNNLPLTDYLFVMLYPGYDNSDYQGAYFDNKFNLEIERRIIFDLEETQYESKI